MWSNDGNPKWAQTTRMSTRRTRAKTSWWCDFALLGRPVLFQRYVARKAVSDQLTREIVAPTGETTIVGQGRRW
jgi:hypothetical protein